MPTRLSRDIRRLHLFVTLRETGDIYVYNDDLGIYSPRGEELIREEVAKALGEAHRKRHADEVVYHIKVSTFSDRTELQTPPHILALENGILNLRTRELEPYKPDYFILNKIPVHYDPNAKCPRILQFLNEILDTHDIPVIQELFGYCLLKDYHIHKAFMFVGGGRNGKSTLINLLEAFLGKENVSGVSLYDLNTRRFAAAELHDKLANLFADLPDQSLTYTGKFKMLTGGDLILAERKWKDPFLFRNYAKLIFSTNKMPQVDDDTTAFFRRWIIINFPNEFPPDKADPKILEKLTTPEELSGLLNWALDGLHRLLKQGRFTRSETVDEVMDRWRRMADPVYAFLEDMTVIDPTASTPKDKLYAAYVEYCRRHGLPTKAKNIFSQELHRHRPNITEERTRQGKKRTRCWQGIRLIDENKPETPHFNDKTEGSGTGPSGPGGPSSNILKLHSDRLQYRNEVKENGDHLDHLDQTGDPTEIPEAKIPGTLIEDVNQILKKAQGELGILAFLDELAHRGYNQLQVRQLMPAMRSRGLIDYDDVTVKTLTSLETSEDGYDKR